MNTLALDLRQSLRALRRAPGFLVAAVVSLALGIGVNTAAFSALRAALDPHLAWKNPQELMDVGRQDASYPMPGATLDVTYPTFKLWQEHQTVLAPLAAYDRNVVVIGGSIEPRSALVSRVSPEFWPLLGTRPLLGRLPYGDEEGALVVSHRFWVRVLGGDLAVVGKSFQVDGRPHTLVGVLPFAAVWRGVEAFVPLEPSEQERSGASGSFLLVVGRTRPGVTDAAAATTFQTLSAQLRASDASQRGITAVARPLLDRFYGRFRDRQALLGWVCLFVTALACVNLCTLVLGRSASRLHELGIRQAIGASRAQLFTPLLSDLLIAAVPGLLLGWFSATATARLLDAFVPGDLQGFHVPSSMDLAVAAAVALLLAVVGAALPSFLLPKVRTLGLLVGTRASGGRARRWSQSGLVVLQVGLALTLLSSFALVHRSLQRLEDAPIGISAEGRILATLSLPARTPEEASRRQREVARVQERIRALPGVKACGGTDLLPVVSGGGFNGRIPIPGRTEPAFTYGRGATDGYFEAAGIPFVEGRTFRASDVVDDPRALIVSRSFAADYFPGQSVIGRTLPLPGSRSDLTIVGVVEDARMDAIRQEGHTQTIYVPTATNNSRLDLVVHAPGAVKALLPDVRRLLRAEWPDVSLDQVRPLREALKEGTASDATQVVLMGLLAALALLLTVAGLYGALSRLVESRRREMGIRLALGGRGSQVAWLVLRQAMTVVGVGLAVGLAGAIGVGHVLRNQLFGIQPLDPVSHASALLLLAATALLASAIPALRASTTEPFEALREQ
jgi:predicted permease